jgi:hypothetical protein
VLRFLPVIVEKIFVGFSFADQAKLGTEIKKSKIIELIDNF